MKRFRLISLFTLAVLLALPRATAADPLELAFQSVGDQRLSSASLALAGLEPAPVSQTYTLWFIDAAGAPVLLGPVAAGLGFVHLDPAGDNLVGKVSGAVISLESTAALRAGTVTVPGEIVYSGEIPPSILPAVRQLVVQADDTPNGAPYDPGMKAQVTLALSHGTLSLSAIETGDLAGGRMHVEHVWNILSGETTDDYGDVDGDGMVQDPSDGYGVLRYAFKVAEVADAIAATPGLSGDLREAAGAVSTCARNVSNLFVPAAKQHAQAVLDAGDAAGAREPATAMVEALTTMLDGTDVSGNGEVGAIAGECGSEHAYQFSHGLFHIQLLAR